MRVREPSVDLLPWSGATGGAGRGTKPCRLSIIPIHSCQHRFTEELSNSLISLNVTAKKRLTSTLRHPPLRTQGLFLTGGRARRYTEWGLQAGATDYKSVAPEPAQARRLAHYSLASRRTKRLWSAAMSLSSAENAPRCKNCEHGDQESKYLEPALSTDHLRPPLFPSPLFSERVQDFAPLPCRRVRTERVRRRKTSGLHLRPEFRPIEREVAKQVTLFDPGILTQGRGQYRCCC